MSFINILNQYNDFCFDDFFNKIRPGDIDRVLSKDILKPLDYLMLLSPSASDHLEAMAVKSQQLTHRHFGKVIFLYAPLYLANHCINGCVYCSFSVGNNIVRKSLTKSELNEEAEKISQTGIKHILLLTGESRNDSPVSYIAECVKTVKRFFTSVSIEVYPLETDEYKQLIKAGVDGLTVYQEVYNKNIYNKVHLSGPKANYRYRLDTPERGCKAGMRSVGTGALLGLNNWRHEAFFTGLHADYLQNKYPGVEVGISLPRIRPHVGSFKTEFPVNDKELVQIMLAQRLFLPYAGITVSTRECSKLRDNLVGLGVTKMSAGSATEVGGYAGKIKSGGQFDISDTRSVEEVCSMLKAKCYQPVFKDWQYI